MLKPSHFLLLTFIFITSIASAQYPAQNFTLISLISPETGTNPSGVKYSGCWGWYQGAKNKEYAIACSQKGTYWVDVTNPVTPTVSAYRAGTHAGATWRETKTYQNYCYVISDDGGANSFQIFDMQYLPDSVKKVHDDVTIFKTGHALWIDGDKMYVSGVKYSNGSGSFLNVYSLATPTAPALLRSISQDAPFISSVHDSYARRDTVYVSCGYQGLYVFKFTTANTFTQLGSLTSYSTAGYNHSSALTPNGKTLVFMDEVPSGLPIKVADVTNLANIQVKAYKNQFTTTTPHNPFVVSNQYCFVSSYQDGLQLIDISTPTLPLVAGFFDTYPQGGGNTGNYGGSPYNGQWGCYPFFPSKNIFALDMTNGIFMLKTSLYQNPVTGVEHTAAEEPLITLFPNPVSHELHFTIPVLSESAQLTASIYDGSGKMILQKNLPATGPSGHQTIDIKGLADGVYQFVLMSGDKKLAHNKVIISN